MMEFFFDILKSEMFYSYEKTSKSLNQLEQVIVYYLDYYNNKRIKVKLKPIRLTPKNWSRFSSSSIVNQAMSKKCFIKNYATSAVSIRILLRILSTLKPSAQGFTDHFS